MIQICSFREQEIDSIHIAVNIAEAILSVLEEYFTFWKRLFFIDRNAINMIEAAKMG